MATDPVFGAVSGPVNKKSSKDRNLPGKTSGGVKVTNARTRTAGPPTTGGGRPSGGALPTPAKAAAQRKAAAAGHQVKVPVLRPKMTKKSGSGPS